MSDVKNWPNVVDAVTGKRITPEDIYALGAGRAEDRKEQAEAVATIRHKQLSFSLAKALFPLLVQADYRDPDGDIHLHGAGHLTQTAIYAAMDFADRWETLYDESQATETTEEQTK